MRRFCTFVEVKPDGALKLIARVQQENISLLATNFFDFRKSPRDSSETRRFSAFTRVLVGLLHSCVNIISVEQSQLKLCPAHMTVNPDEN